MGMQIAFYFFAAMTLGFALISLLHKNVVHSAFSLLGTLLGISGLYVTLNADFLAMTQVLIYAGGILMLLLFGLMLTKPSEGERSLKRIIVAVVLAGGTAVLSAYKMAGTTWASSPGELPESTVTEIGLEFLRFDQWLIAFEFASVVLLAALVGAVHIARRRFPIDDTNALLAKEQGEDN